MRTLFNAFARHLDPRKDLNDMRLTQTGDEAAIEYMTHVGKYLARGGIIGAGVGYACAAFTKSAQPENIIFNFTMMCSLIDAYQFGFRWMRSTKQTPNGPN